MRRFLKNLTFFTPFLIFASLFLFGNCSSDGDGESENSNFVGTWAVSSVEAEITIGGTPLIQYLVDNGDLNEIEAALIETLFKSELMDELGEGEIILNSDNTYSADFGDDPDTGKWSYNSSTGELTIDSDDPSEDTQIIKVKSITSSTLIIEQMETVEEDINDDGTIDEIDAAIEITLVKS